MLFMSTQLKLKVGPLDNIHGDFSAAITPVEYGDYQCPHCRHADKVVKQIQELFGYQLKFVFRNFPLGGIHPLAVPAAIAAEAAARQNKFWEMHQLIYESQHQLFDKSFRLFAEELGLNVVQF